ncbi:MAG: hypothetical protein F4107_14135 [Gemmatimonadetes bacterium]|nr:hypothetical protein [Gemmatimonadota bacterium]MYD12340.1 hypothetical protein [Gemmatimonadota bacterium]MYI67057.1 hypothetical protein [Gemmatimonadota bacterium]
MKRSLLIPLALAASVFVPVPGDGPAALSAQDEVVLPMGTRLRVTGATVLRGGPAAPPIFAPVPLEGNAVGLHGDTLLLDIGPNEPVLWIPLGHDPLVEQQAAVGDLARSLLVGTSVFGAAGATFAWALKGECTPNETAVELGLADPCAEEESDAAVALRGFAVGVGVGAVAGFVINRFARRQAWVPVSLEGLRLGGGAGGTGIGFSVRFPVPGA